MFIPGIFEMQFFFSTSSSIIQISLSFDMDNLNY